MKFKKVRVRFWNGYIDAIENEDGKRFVIPRHVCEAFGLSWASQCKKLQSTHWARMETIFWEDSRGHRRKVYILPIGNLPIWLTLIHPKKVGDYARKQLMSFQTEASEALERLPIPDWLVKKEDLIVITDDVAPSDRDETQEEQS